ncbi:hypothetical protein ACIQVE_22760 [Pseudomonas sp. NPDC098747]
MKIAIIPLGTVSDHCGLRIAGADPSADVQGRRTFDKNGRFPRVRALFQP